MMNLRMAAAIALSLPLFPAGVAQAAEPDYSQVIATLDREIPQMMADDATVGLTLALVDGQNVIATRGYGYADREAGTPVTPDTLFHIGSVSKTFTAIAVMQLVEQGKVNLDAPLSRYVPEFSMLPRFKNNKITVRTVMDHHSGIPGDMFNGLITEGKPYPQFRSRMIEALSKTYPERRVNTQMAYNNSGVVLLQNLVESVTGQDFENYTHEHMFTPMGMPDSSFNDTLAPDSAVTRNYKMFPDGKVRVKPREYVNGWAAGSILSSADDMANYLRMLNARGAGLYGQVIQASTLERMLTQQTHLPLDILYVKLGLAWILYPNNWSGFMYGHDGGTVYNFTKLYVLPGTGLAAFASANTNTPGIVVGKVAQRALDLAYTAKTGIEPPLTPDLPIRSSDLPTAKYVRKQAGVWSKTNGYDLVRANGTSLKLVTDADLPSESSVVYHRMQGGWWRSKAQPALQIKLRTIQGRRIMVGRTSDTSGIYQYVISERAGTPTIPTAWRDRFGKYQAIDAVPDVAREDLARRAVLRQRHGVMLLVRPGVGTEVLQPIKRDVAFSFGMGPGLARGKGNAVKVQGKKLVYMGVTYAPAQN